jgi:hypothetical protein
MKWVRRGVLIIAIISIVVCIVLLLNFTASNPTHRRYSSKMPLTTGQGVGGDIGLDGEYILSKDLGLPRNEEEDQRKCLCGIAGLTDQQRCNSCLVSLASIQTYRVPDFVSSKFIADAKNQQKLLVTDRDFEQMGDYAEGAQALDIPLWVFVRVNTVVDPGYREVVRSTGGDIVYYFTVPGYEDATDEAAKTIIVIAGITGGVGVWFEVRPARPRPRRRKPDALERGTAAVDSAEHLLHTIKSKVRDE